jgi:hypothetical protein
MDARFPVAFADDARELDWPHAMRVMKAYAMIEK